MTSKYVQQKAQLSPRRKFKLYSPETIHYERFNMQNVSSALNSYRSYAPNQILWFRVVSLFLFHCIALQGAYYVLTLSVKWRTCVFHYLVALVGGQGITSGVHRLWCHKAYKAKLPLRVFLCFLQTMTFQTPIYDWCRDHRVHHKFTDTNADPHNASRGFFFSHMGWLMLRKHPDVIKLGKTVDLSDLKEDPVVRFQRQYFSVLAPICGVMLPTLVPWYFWNENMYISLVVGMFRYVLTLHITWSVNSVAHMWGMRPYDKTIKPAENFAVSFFTGGEGWHNYHHAFPWDYKAAELGTYDNNLTTAFIDLMAKFGQAYDLRSASDDMIKKRRKRTGIL